MTADEYMYVRLGLLSESIRKCKQQRKEFDAFKLRIRELV